MKRFPFEIQKGTHYFIFGAKTINHIAFTMYLVCFVFSVGVVQILAYKDISVEQGPQSKIIVEGERTSFVCDFNDDNTRNIFWSFISSTDSHPRLYLSYNNHVYLSVPQRDKYEVNIHREKQIYELVLKSPTLSDSGLYACGCILCRQDLASSNLTVLHADYSQSCQVRFVSSNTTSSEIVCVWSHIHVEFAHFETSNGQIIDAELTFPDRIISKVNFHDLTTILCTVTLDKNASRIINTPCTLQPRRSGQLQVRVDPIVKKVRTGQNASFFCRVDGQDLNNANVLQSWTITNFGNFSFTEGRDYTTDGNFMTIFDVGYKHEDIMIECKISEGDDTELSSFGGLRIAEAGTTVVVTLVDGSTSSQHEEMSNNERNTISSIIAVPVVIIFCIGVAAVVLYRKCRKIKTVSMDDNEHAFSEPGDQSAHKTQSSLQRSDANAVATSEPKNLSQGDLGKVTYSAIGDEIFTSRTSSLVGQSVAHEQEYEEGYLSLAPKTPPVNNDHIYSDKIIKLPLDETKYGTTTLQSTDRKHEQTDKVEYEEISRFQDIVSEEPLTTGEIVYDVPNRYVGSYAPVDKSHEGPSYSEIDVLDINSDLGKGDE